MSTHPTPADALPGLSPILWPRHRQGNPIIIAGPCSAESESQLLATAHRLADNGITVLRAGLWKPRTKPGGFEGVGQAGLPWLAKAKKETGMATATEVAMPEHVRLALDAGIDMLWIGARTTANPFAVQAIADELEYLGADVPVLVKNPVNTDLELWIGALQRLAAAGTTRLAAVHRGFSDYAALTYRNPPQWHIAMELRRRCPSLPIICDPSHIAGRADLVGPVARQACDLGLDGLMVESHCRPSEALSDAAQQLTPTQLADMLASLHWRRTPTADNRLALLRSQIDDADNELLDVLRRRMEICREVGQYKKHHGMTVLQADRYSDMLQARMASAGEIGLDPEFVKRILTVVHDESVRRQLEIFRPEDDENNGQKC